MTWNEKRTLENARARDDEATVRGRAYIQAEGCDNCGADEQLYPVRVGVYTAEVCRSCWSAMREANA